MKKQISLFFLCSALVIAWISLSSKDGEDLVSSIGRRLSETYVGHKDLFPMDSSDYVGTFLVVLGLLVAASGGIGGGGILVPLLILVFGFSPKHAVPLSNFTILGSSFMNMALNIPKRHPDADRPLVDWDLILVMEPLTMAGAIVGAFVSKIVPDWILVISLVILLAFTTYTTLEKGFQQWKRESETFEKERKSVLAKALMEQEEADERESLIPKGDKKSEQAGKGELELKKLEAGNKEKEKLTDPVDPELAALLKAESETPWDKVNMVTIMVVVAIALNLVKGGGHSFPSPLGIECGSNSYWFVTGLVFVWVLGVSLYMRHLLIEKWMVKKRLGYKYLKGDVEWNPTNTIVYPSICFFAGFAAGLFGIGGGIVKGPLMLQMGVNPLVASGTVAVMILYTSVAATTMYMAFGTLTWDYGLFLFFWGLVATAVGQFGVSYLVKKYRRVSLVSLSIGAVVALSTILMGLQSIFSLIDAENGSAQSSSSNSVCGKS